MGAGMDKILPGLYVGSIKDSRDIEQLKKNSITHILSIHEDPKEGGIEGIKYLCFKACDNASQEIKVYFSDAIDFIHYARINNGNVLVHCLAGISRSTTLVISYIMTIVEMPWYDALNAVRAARKGANPNFGFQRQLQSFEYTTIKTVRENLFKKYGVYDKTADEIHCQALLESYKQAQIRYNADIANLQQVNFNSVKNYPLPYNAYNLDEDKQTKQNPKSNTPNNQTINEANNQKESLNENNISDDNNNNKEKEKQEVVDKIFG